MLESTAPGPVGHPLFGRLFAPGPGCGRACSRWYGHDPFTHEAYGRDAVRAELSRRRIGVVRTGSLAVDFDATRVSVDGLPIMMPPLEFGLLSLLAERLGRVVGHREIAESVWDSATAELWGAQTASNGKWHAIRINMLRVRRRLAGAADLLETVNGFGYRLRDEPAGAR